jgi:hypothetical protein
VPLELTECEDECEGLLESKGDFSIEGRLDEMPRPLGFSSPAFIDIRNGEDIRRGDEAAIGDSNAERHLKESVECLLTI